MSSKATTYKRAQVLWALWAWFAPVPRTSESMLIDSTFVVRLKRLLDTDRKVVKLVGDRCYAFSKEGGRGKGTEQKFSAFDAFCLSLGLDMLQVGYNQQDIVFLLRHIRSGLGNRYRRIMKDPPAFRQLERPRETTGEATYTEEDSRVRDPRVFMVVRKVEIKEAFPSLLERPKSAGPVFIEPTYLSGIESLSEELHRMGHGYRTANVFELANTAAEVTSLLKVAPEFRRGPR